ncbi:putative transmembrane protein [Toxoplasma gondii RUB]|uniref:Putative transmembrane protein n=1 Tax=Toxoplasma gondii RUB TaxID=935652 RepID=A0A086M9H7_TOXGO|nr:putative transmembrane protein [Toxoplasma gondii RUB]
MGRHGFGICFFFSSFFFLFFSHLRSLQVSAGVRLRSFSGRNVEVLPLSPLRWTQALLPSSLARGVAVRVHAAPECVAFAECPAWITEKGTTDQARSGLSPLSPFPSSSSSFSSSLRSSPSSPSSSSSSSSSFSSSSSVLFSSVATAVHRPGDLLAAVESLCREANSHVSSDEFSSRPRASMSSFLPPLHASTSLGGSRGPERKGRRNEQGCIFGNRSLFASRMHVSETERVRRRGNVTPTDHLPQRLSFGASSSPPLPFSAFFLRASASPLSRPAVRFLPPASSSFSSSRLFSSTASSSAQNAAGEKRETGDEGEEDVRWRGQVRYADPLRDALEGRETAAEREQATLFSNDVFFEFCGSLGDDESLQEAADKALRRKKTMRRHFDDMLAYGRRLCAKQSAKREEEASASDAKGELSGEKSGDRDEQEDEAPLGERGRVHAGREERGEGRGRVSRHKAGSEKDGGRPASRREGEGLSEKIRRIGGEVQAESQNRKREEQAGDQGGEQEETQVSSDSHHPGTRRNSGAQRGKELKGVPFRTSEKNCREQGKTESSASPHLTDASSSSFSSSGPSPSHNAFGTWFEVHEAQVGHFMKRTRARAWGEKLRIGDKDVTLVSEAWGRSPSAQAKREQGERTSRQKPALRLPEVDEKAGDGGVLFDDEDDQDLPDIVQSPNRAAWLEETWIEGGDSYTRSSSSASSSSSSSSSQCLDGLDFFGAAGGWRSCRHTAEEVDSAMDAMVEETEGSARRELFDAFDEISEKDEAIKQLLDSRPRRQTRAACGVFGESEETANGEATAADLAQGDNSLWAEKEGLVWGEGGATEAGCALNADSKVEDASCWQSGCGEEEGQEGRARGRVDENHSVDPKSGGVDVWQIVAQATETERPDSGFWES